jgi:hypothetical protein
MHQIHVSRALITVAVRTCRFAGLAGLGVPRRRYGHRGLRLAALAGVLAAFGFPGVWQSVAVASSSPVLNWTRQAPATSPPARELASMAYDAATGNVVLFGGDNFEPQTFNDTWTWGSG